MRLLELRKQSRADQTVIAQAVGISQSFYSQLETGARTPSVPILRRLAAYFSVTVDELLSEPATQQEAKSHA